MDLNSIVILFIAGIAGGIINALAGGATLITFPAMLAAGLPPITANASNAVAISPGHLIAALADREKWPEWNNRTWKLIALATLGGASGATVLLLIPESLFLLPVPALIAFATLLFAFAPQIQARGSHRHDISEASSSQVSNGVIAVACVYGGFFGAGLGVILTAVLSITEPNDIRAIKALKNILASCVAIASTIIFIVQGAISWPETIMMMIGALFGGYGGGYLIRVLPGIYVRRFVILAGAVMSLIYALRYWS
jgi:uncharacterized membrane protein YfcA